MRESVNNCFIRLFEEILKTNDYYKHLGKLYKQDKSIANALYWAFDDRQPISVYGFLDSVEAKLENTKQQCDLWDLFEQIDFEEGWLS